MARRLMILFVILFLAAACSGLVYAKDPRELDQIKKYARNLDQMAPQVGSEKTYQILASELNVPVDVLQSQKQKTSFGFGELFIANALAQSSGKTFDSVAAEFKQGKGWGVIAQENGLNLGSVVSRIKRSNQAMEKERNSIRAREREKNTERANRPSQEDRPQAKGQPSGGRGRR